MTNLYETDFQGWIEDQVNLYPLADSNNLELGAN